MEKIRDMAGRLFEEPGIAESVAQVPDFPITVEDVPGNRVDREHIGMAYYDTNKIKIPTFGDVVKYARGSARQVYKHARQAVRRYILEHEKNELRYQPQDRREHGMMEAENLARLENTNPDAYLAGLAMHKARLEGSRKDRAFSRNTGYFYNFGKKFRQYAEYLDERKDLVIDVITGQPRYKPKPVPVYAAGRRYRTN
jgi:hypothetical protein